MTVSPLLTHIDHSAASIIGIIIATTLLTMIGPRVVTRLLSRHGAITSAGAFARHTVRLTVLLLGLTAILPLLGYTTLPLVSGATVVLTISLGLQNVMTNGFDGFALLVERVYSVGDVITVAGSTGMVSDIGLRATVLDSLDGETSIPVPNSVLFSNPIIVKNSAEQKVKACARLQARLLYAPLPDEPTPGLVSAAERMAPDRPSQ